MLVPSGRGTGIASRWVFAYAHDCLGKGTADILRESRHILQFTSRGGLCRRCGPSIKTLASEVAKKLNH
jgi:hypothetical protein